MKQVFSSRLRAHQKSKARFPSYLEDLEKCKNFLQTHEGYKDQIQKIANRQRTVIEINMEDLKRFFIEDTDFIYRVKHNTARYLTLFCNALDQIMPAPTVSLADLDVIDVLNRARLKRMDDAKQKFDDESFNSNLPAELSRRYELYIVPEPEGIILPIREIKAPYIGSLVSLKGQVIRVSDVQPLLLVATYNCDRCGYESYQTVNAKQFMPLTLCPSPVCKINNWNGKLFNQVRGSKFTKFQEIRIQELSNEVPTGHIPRSVAIQCTGELTRKCTPGDIVVVSGIYLTMPFTGYKAIKAGLTADPYIKAMSIRLQKKVDINEDLSTDLKQQIEEYSLHPKIYNELAYSIAPEIFGLEDVKKALLLQLVGGVTRELGDIKIRGDINILLMGDPGVAKSQLLKHLTRIAPRAVYTNGKGSSGVGLTAAVLRDPVSGEMALEGGALVMADKGICCIDEFDKMEESDKTAIHEVMEQQTVSIAKAGIIATLNARTAIVAAANPVYGRWDSSMSAERNLNLPTALLSRFDITYVLLDKADEQMDEALAKHVTFVHMNNSHPILEVKPLDAAFLRGYIAKAKTYTPYIPQELSDFIAGAYVGMRNENMNFEQNNFKDKVDPRQRFCTARSLLSILRLCQALARIHFRDEVNRNDVDEAIRLLDAAKRSSMSEKELKAAQKDDPKAAIYRMIISYAREQRTQDIKRSEILDRILHRGYQEAVLDEVLDDYEDLAVWTVSHNRTKIHLHHPVR